jgi:hypothetical protein
MSDNLDKRLKRVSDDQSGHSMVAVVKGRNSRRIYMIEYNIPAIIGFIVSSVEWYEKFCNTKLPFKEILDGVGKKLGISKNLSYYLLDDKSRKHILEELEKPKYSSEDHKISLIDFEGFMATHVVLAKNNKECLEKGKEKDIIVENLVDYLKPEIGSWEFYNENLFYKIRFIGYNLKKRLEEVTNEQLVQNMVVIKEWKDKEKRYVIEYNIPAIIGFIESSVEWYEKFCNAEPPFEEILNEVGKKLGITEDLSSYLLNKKSIEYIFEQLKKPKYPSGNYKISDVVELFGFMAAKSVLVKNEEKCLEKGKEKEVMVEILLNYLKPETGSQKDYKDSIFYKIRAYKL